MRRRYTPLSGLAQYLLAILATALTTTLLIVVQDNLSAPIIALLYLLPVVLSTSLGGLGPGIASALFAFLSFNFFFIPPLYTFTVHQPRDVLVLVVFLLVAVFISQILGHARASAAAATAR